MPIKPIHSVDSIKAAARAFCTGALSITQLKSYVDELSPTERRVFDDECRSVSGLAAFVGGYAMGRSARVDSGDNEMPHRDAIRDAINLRKRVRRELGFTFPDDMRGVELC